jgi:hypothetical protein
MLWDTDSLIKNTNKETNKTFWVYDMDLYHLYDMVFRTTDVNMM